MAQEPPIEREDVNEIMWALGDIRRDVERIRILLEEDDDQEDEADEES